MTRMYVKDEYFVAKWQECKGDAAMVADHLGLLKQSCVLRAKRLRELGVPLVAHKKGTPGRKRTSEDIARLVALISEGGGESEDSAENSENPVDIAETV